MSNNKPNNQNQTNQSEADKTGSSLSAVLTENQLQTSENPDDYPFPQYDTEGIPRLLTDHKHMLREGVDTTPWHITWLRYNELDDCARRYFRVIRKDTHGDMFLDSAFDASGTISVGPIIKDRRELTLCIRPKAADVAELKAIMRQVSSFVQAPMSSKRGQEIAENMERLVHAAGEGNVQFVTSDIARSSWDLLAGR